MNILFITYGGFRSNSLNHISVFAEGLATLGHACCVAVPHGIVERTLIPQSGFTNCLHSDLLNTPSPFLDGRQADIIHAWTPRNGVLETLLGYQRRIPAPARVIVHLEDNEQHLLSSTAGVHFSDLLLWSERRLGKLLKKGLVHPVRHQLLLAVADVVTVITPALADFVPAGTLISNLHPGIDGRFFNTPGIDHDLSKRFGLGPNYRVIVYPGGANLTNADDLRTLYSAVALLNQRGYSVKLVRTGPSTPWFIATLAPDEQACSIELGFVERACIPQLLSIADVLVQPGRPDPFNDYRLPSKIPEFLAAGKPVVLPATNIALQMRDGFEALFLNEGSSEDIANCCERIFNDPLLAKRLGIAGRSFAEKNFDATVNCRHLETLYKEVLSRPPVADWSLIRRRGYDEADLFPLASGRVTPGNILELAQRRRNCWQHLLNVFLGSFFDFFS